MRTISEQELKNILDKHGKWLRSDPEGERADLSYADLSSANLRSANLRSANLRSADLSYADLSSANLRSADLSSANLRSADLSYADLRSADLRSANLRSADLRSANLSSANLRSADLRSANLRSADLSYADLSSANLRSADLSLIKKDFLERLKIAQHEIVGLYDFLIRGKIDGTSYEGECSCFVGTVAKIAKQPYKELSSGLKPDAASPTERWFMGIRKGDTPENNQVSRFVKDWIEEFAEKNEIELPKFQLVSSFDVPEL